MGNHSNLQAEPDFFSLQVRESRRFYLDLSPPTDTRLAVVCGGVESCTGDYKIQRSTFPYHSIEMVSSGRGTLVLAGVTHRLVPGSVFSYGPAVSQRIQSDPNRPLVKYFVDFVGTRSESLLHESQLTPGSHVTTAAPAEVQEMFDQLIRDGQRATALVDRLSTALLEYLVTKIADSVLPDGGRPSHAYVNYQRCRSHIMAKCDSLMSLSQIARECHVDRAYLCRLFRRFDHQTPHQFLMQRKMNLAAARLNDPSLLVRQVARECGFADPFHFSRVFKRVFGLSPDAFRRLRQP